jgi:hypothetical protein
MRLTRSTVLLLGAVLLAGPALGLAARFANHADAPSSFLASTRAEMARRVRVARVVTEVTLSLVERALDGSAAAVR